MAASAPANPTDPQELPDSNRVPSCFGVVDRGVVGRGAIRRHVIGAAREVVPTSTGR
jgi:hypothetical protein